MMGRTHAATGAAAGAAVALAYGAATGHTGDDPALLVAGTLLGTGAALAPDIDHPQATVTHAHGGASRALGWGVRRLSALAYRATATQADRRSSGQHRHLTHTPVAALAVGGAVAVGVVLWWQVAALVLWLTLSAALRGAAAALPVRAGRDWSTWITVSALAAAGTAALLAWGGPAITGPYIGACIAAGWVTHILGDALTHSAAPLAWPLRINGQRWAMVGTPRWLRFTTGSPIEHAIGLAGWSVPAVTAYALIA